MWTQVVGKVRLALMPMVNHWWQVPLYVTARGLTTSLMPVGSRGLEMTFDFDRHLLDIRTTDGGARQVELRPRLVADLCAEVMGRLAQPAVQVNLLLRPVEVPEAIPFPADERHARCDPEYVHRFWLSLVQAHRVLSRFRARFLGKVGPVGFFWGAFDLAVTRFSGRRAPGTPVGFPTAPTG